VLSVGQLKTQWILKALDCFQEGNPVLSKVLNLLGEIPFEFHRMILPYQYVLIHAARDLAKSLLPVGRTSRLFSPWRARRLAKEVPARFFTAMVFCGAQGPGVITHIWLTFLGREPQN
jgi:hypothetical protein